MSETKDKYQELFERLERATTALESIVSKNIDSTTKTDGVSGVGSNVTSAGASETSEASEAGENAAEASEEDASFNELLELYVDPFVSHSNELGNDEIIEITNLFLKAFKFQAVYIKTALKSKKPTDFSGNSAIKDLQTLLVDITNYKESHFKSKVYFQLNAVAEGANVFNWLFVETPFSYIGDIKDSVVFWTNKALTGDSGYKEWVKLYLNIFEGLKLYVKQNHSTGLKFGDGDFEANYAKLSGSLAEPAETPSQTPVPAAPAPSAGGPPPPPPPPPPADLFAEESSSSSAAAPASGKGLGAVFSELNKGENITKGLKKVDKSQMTHKNPELRASSVVSGSSGPSSGKKSPPIPKKPVNLTVKPPVIELKDSKWIVKNVKDKHDIKLDVERSQSLFIADSENITIQLNGKLNAIQVNNVKKLGLVIDSLISEISIINTKKFGVQITGFVPQFSIDNSDGGEIYLNEQSLGSEVYTTCVTGLNLYVPDEDGFKEVNVPEQFKFKLNNGKLVNEIVEHA